MPIIPHRSELPRLIRQPAAFARAYWLPLSILLIGATADTITTWRSMRLYGITVETHLVQRWVSEMIGINLGVPLAKLIQFGFVLLVAAWWRPWTPWLLTLCGLLYGAAAISNHFALF